MTGWAGYCWNVYDWSVTRAPNDKEWPHGPCVTLGGTCGERRQKERQCRLPQPTSGKTRSEVEAGPGADRGDRMSHLTIRHAGVVPAVTRSPLGWSVQLVRPVRQAGGVVRGNPVGIRDCPAAVSGNDRRHTHWTRQGLGSDGQ